MRGTLNATANRSLRPKPNRSLGLASPSTKNVAPRRASPPPLPPLPFPWPLLVEHRRHQRHQSGASCASSLQIWWRQFGSSFMASLSFVGLGPLRDNGEYTGQALSGQPNIPLRLDCHHSLFGHHLALRCQSSLPTSISLALLIRVGTPFKERRQTKDKKNERTDKAKGTTTAQLNDSKTKTHSQSIVKGLNPKKEAAATKEK